MAPTKHENCQVLSSPLIPACGRQGGGLRRELSRTIEVAAGSESLWLGEGWTWHAPLTPALSHQGRGG